ncbi:hypothetical protein ACN4EG_15045 [Alkalinema pantanalense CENA528]|uniref:hypothetical protein n=1 Tax=Alkalinema pantanalense TaxID=1620705 RepID=UPI003D6F0CBD
MLAFAAVPALLLSFWLLPIAGASHLVRLQQGLFAGGGVVLFVLLASRRFTWPVFNAQGVKVALALVTLLPPLLAGFEGVPNRWLLFWGMRLYVAPIVLPLTLFLFATAARFTKVDAVAIAIVAIALMIQPDAAQATAFSLAMVLILARRFQQFRLRWAIAVLLLSCPIVTWQLPDLLAPVRYVEGVFQVAGEVSPLLFILAIICVSFPIVGLVWSSYQQRTLAALAIAIYYSALLMQAPLQLTPVPLLGFGAGPILGYFMVAGVLSWRPGLKG